MRTCTYHLEELHCTMLSTVIMKRLSICFSHMELILVHNDDGNTPLEMARQMAM